MEITQQHLPKWVKQLIRGENRKIQPKQAKTVSNGPKWAHIGQIVMAEKDEYRPNCTETNKNNQDKEWANTR